MSTYPWSRIQWNTRVKTLKRDEAAFETEAPWLYTTPQSLITIKDRIAALNEDVWEYYKKLANPYELIFTTNGLIPTPPSVCMLHPLSRSYFKMIEILQVCSMFERFQGQNIRTAHVCEGPGGFIQAIYDEADRLRTRVSHSYAITLKPMENQVPGWKRAMNFLKKNPGIKIIYGANQTGDILDAANRQSFYDECRPGVHIFTADGGVDFADNYREQEKTIYPLLIASAVMGLRCLTENGIFVLKIFDCFTQATEDLVHGLASCFSTWTLYKPATSRPCNSEQYFIGMGYRKLLGEAVGRTFERILASPFLPTHIWQECGETAALQERQLGHAQAQCESIAETLALADAADVKGHTEIWEQHIRASQVFCQQFHLPLIAAAAGQKVGQLESVIGAALADAAAAVAAKPITS
jgi:23S rRNA U2552 (ribose-2'-O)-methylase RlmE/FtsJ